MLRINNWIRRIELPLCYFAVGPINTKHCGYLGIFYSSFDETTSMHRWSIELPLGRRFLWREPSPSFQFNLVERIVSTDRNTNGPRFDSFCESSFALIQRNGVDFTIFTIDFIAPRGRGNWKILVISFGCENSANLSYRVWIGKKFERNVCYCQMYYTRYLTVQLCHSKRCLYS